MIEIVGIVAGLIAFVVLLFMDKILNAKSSNHIGAKDIAETREAAEQGNSDAQLNLGLSYYKGFGMANVYEEANKYIKKIAASKTENESIINPNANRVRMPIMTFVQYMDGLSRALKTGTTIRELNYNNNIIAKQNVHDFIDEHIMFERVRNKIKKDIDAISLVKFTPEEYFAKVTEIINGYNNVVDMSKDLEKNAESANKYIYTLYPNVDDASIRNSLIKKLSTIITNAGDRTLRSGKELKEISNLIAVAEQYNTVNHANDNKSNISAKSRLVDGYLEGKNDWKNFISEKVNYLVELLRQNRNNVAIRNKIITTIREVSNIVTAEGADKTLSRFDNEINAIFDNENMKNSASAIIKTIKEFKRLGTRANEFYKLFTNIRASMPKSLCATSILRGNVPVVISATDVKEIKEKLDERIYKILPSNIEEADELSLILKFFEGININTVGSIDVKKLSADELEAFNNALIALATMTSADFVDCKNQIKKATKELENLMFSQLATTALKKGKTTLPRIVLTDGRDGLFVRQDIIKNVGESLLNYLYEDLYDNMSMVNIHNQKVREEIAKLDENNVDDVPKINALRNELITETAITQEDLNLLDSIFGKKYPKTLVGSSVDEIGALTKILNYKADTLLNSDEEFQNKTGQSVKLLSTMFDNIYNTMKLDRVNYMNAINKIIGNKQPSPMIMNNVDKAVNKPLTTWTVSDFEAFGALVARYSIDNGLASQQYVDENPVDIGILNMFSPKVFEKQGGKISKNLLSNINYYSLFRKLKYFVGLDSSKMANNEADVRLMKILYKNIQNGKDISIEIADALSDGFFDDMQYNNEQPRGRAPRYRRQKQRIQKSKRN